MNNNNDVPVITPFPEIQESVTQDVTEASNRRILLEEELFQELVQIRLNNLLYLFKNNK